MKYLMGLILSLISVGGFAAPINLPACTINNQPVRYQSVQAKHLNAYDLHRWVASAGAQKGYPVIAYNSTLLSSKPKEWSLQVLLHECAHLKLHHTDAPFFSKEYDADCHSVTILKDVYGYKDEQFDIVVSTMKEILPPDRIKAINSCLKR